MHLLEDGVPTNHSINIGMNGNDDHSDYDTSETESDMEEPEPVCATLVLRVVNDPASPPASRKSSDRKDETTHPGNTDTNHRETFLQVFLSQLSSVQMIWTYLLSISLLLPPPSHPTRKEMTWTH